ncbi:probable protein kinase ORF73 at C-terminar half [Coccomyxa sp. Obi]|nr:probable protein kinase ORF73 at C-terminar half [Coccomyxa sp. Obi]
MEKRSKLGGRTCTAFEAHPSATSMEVAVHGGSPPLSGASAASRVAGHPRSGTGIDESRARRRSPALQDAQITATDMKRRQGAPKRSSIEKGLKRKPVYDTANEDSIASRVTKRARGAAAPGREFTPGMLPSATPSEQSYEAPTIRRGRHPPSARHAFRVQALDKHVQSAATEKLRRQAAEAKARALQDQPTILACQEINLESQLSSNVREAQQLQQTLDHRKAASSQNSEASREAASKASTRQEARDEQGNQLKQHLQFDQVASADRKRAAEHATNDGAMRKAQALHWKQQAVICMLRTHKTVTSLELPQFPVALKRASMEGGRRELAARTQRTEEAMLALLRHPHIIEGRGKVKESGRDIPSLLLELADNDLIEFQNDMWLGHGEHLCPQLQLMIAEHCALGLQHMHAFGYCHSDLKPDNILLFDSKNGELRAKIADLGMAALCDRATGRVVPGHLAGGTEPYRRPDAIMDESLAGFCDDFYGYGMCLWTMLTGECPQEALWDALLQKVNTPWFARSARIQQETWHCCATQRRHCTLAYCNPHVCLRLQVPEEQAASMPRKYVDLINSLLDPRDDPVTGGPGIPWYHILAIIRECRAELARPARNPAT